VSSGAFASFRFVTLNLEVENAKGIFDTRTQEDKEIRVTLINLDHGTTLKMHSQWLGSLAKSKQYKKSTVATIAAR
jgi:hypothetical protein